MVLSKDMKFAICFGLIMGALISICNMCFAAEVETIEYDVVSGIRISAATSKFVSATGGVGYFYVEPGYKYTVSFAGSGDKALAYSNEVPVLNGDLNFIRVINGNFVYDFYSNQYAYYYFDFTDSNSGYTITREKLEGMTNFVDNMAYSLSIGDLSNVFNLIVPILAISVLFGLGFYLVKRILNKIKRAKGGA